MTEPLIQKLHLTNLLSFGPDAEPITLKSLNVLIGPNGSGKSNLIEAIGLLRAAPRDLSAPVNESGGVGEWLWKGARNPTATIEAIVRGPEHKAMAIRHSLSFLRHGKRFEVTAERIENRDPHQDHQTPYSYYEMKDGRPRLYEKTALGDEERSLQRDWIKPEESILSQVKDPERYPSLAHLTEVYGRIRLYREWAFGRYTPPRQHQKADLPSEHLMETCENLALALNRMRPRAKRMLFDALNSLYPGIEDFNVDISSGQVQLRLEEGEFSIPATRLSDGTLRYLCLLAILCNPDPPPLVCIEEPELGLHPEVLPDLARLMVSASERCQLIVTTHSDMLVDALTDTPESVIVFDKEDGATTTQRLNGDALSEWLKTYGLGELWLKGQIGGTRW